MVRPWIRRLALWLGPTLLLILAWQIWDRWEEKRLQEALERKVFAAPVREPQTAESGARYYSAAHDIADPSGQLRDVSRLIKELRWQAASHAPPSTETRAAVAEALRRYDILFPLLDRAAGMALGEIKDINGYSFSRLDEIHAIATMERLMAGDGDAAVATLFSRVRALRVFDERASISSILAKAQTATAIASDAAVVLGRSPVAPSRLAALDAALAEAFGPRDLESAFRAHVTGLNRLGAPLWGTEATASRMGAAMVLRPLWRSSARTRMLLMAPCIEIAGKPWPARFTDMQALQLPEPDYLIRQFGQQQFPGPIAEEIAYVCRDVTTDVGHAVATVRAARLAMAIERYRARTKQLPDSLSGLDVDAGGADFTDPFTGRLFLYRGDAERFAVYSVGANLKDDGGKVARQTYRLQGAVGAADNPGARDAGVVVELTSGGSR